MMQFYPNSSQNIYLNANQSNNHINNIQQNIPKQHPFFMPSMYAPKPMTNHTNCSQQQFIYPKQRSPVQQFGSYLHKNQQISNSVYPSNSNVSNFDQYSEHSTSCGSDENNQDDFLEALAPISKQQSTQSGWIHKQTKQQPQQYQQPQIVSEEAKYKTEMCKNWVETGKCNYAEKCKFAHGKHELVQKVAANKLFKTKPCKQFFEHATCSYGHRCHFLHDVRSLSEILQNNFYSKRLSNLTNQESADNISNNSTQAQVSRLPIFQRISQTVTSADEINQQQSSMVFSL